MSQQSSPKHSAQATEYMLKAKTRELIVPLLVENILGRESGIATETMSRRHCQIVSKDARWFLADLGSTNGTYLNGKKIKPREWYSLKVGDEIEFGKIVFSFDGPIAEAEAVFEELEKHSPGFFARLLARFRRQT